MIRIEDQEAIRRVLRGEVEAYELVFQKYGRMVYVIALARLRDAAEARALVPEVLRRTYDGLGTISHPVPRLGEALAALTMELCRERLKTRHNPAYILEVPAENASRATAAFDMASVFEGIDEDRAARILVEQAAGLPAQYEVPFLLRFVEGMSYADIAKVLDVSISDVEDLVDKGRRLHEREVRFHLEKIAGTAS
jgi:RNA polymerase sigma factor (sigma-70 family)